MAKPRDQPPPCFPKEDEPPEGPRLLWRPLSEPDLEGAHGLGDVLHLLLAEIIEHDDAMLAQVVPHASRDANPAGLGEGFQPGCDVDAIAKDVPVLHHHVADIDADAQE
jgi:hypothetical protein